jgi:hypothetical protein
MILGHCMQVEIIGVLKPVLAFASSFQPHDVHNMIILMLDLQNIYIYIYISFEIMWA